MTTVAPATLPDSGLVGSTTTWHLPVSPELLVIRADFIAHASSRRSYHDGHIEGSYAPVQKRCRACRWFEARIFREVRDADDPDPERFLLHYAGCTSVPGEVQFTRIEWMHSAEEVVTTLAIRDGGAPGALRFSGIAMRVLDQASSLDEEIAEAWRVRVA